MKKCYMVLAVLGIAMLLSFPKSTARADFGFPVVFSATADTNANTLTLSGINFEANPTVTLGGSQQLSVQSSNSTQIIASLPANLAPGSYLLVVKFGEPAFAVFEVTIGAVGPPGPSGSGGGGDQLFNTKMAASQPLSTSISTATVASLTVPAGTYLILGKTWLQNGDATPNSGGCFLSPGAGTFPFDETNTTLPAGQSDALSLQSAQTFSQLTTITLGCIEVQAGAPSGISASNTVLSALSVGVVTQQ